ncbi:MAG: hypothetical protein JWL97_4341 [Gemmatimonadales bacterium]|nr:hypothetical protein [Gemmatimonadales bacterium]
MSESTASLEYKHFPWGEIIYATKAELQRLGIGAERAFPGEPGGPKRAMKVIDPRGLPTTVDLSYDRERYCARIHFPGREKKPNFRTEFSRGVEKRSEYDWFDEYVGTAEALAAAGLVNLDHLPGQPGMRKMRVTIFSDGTIPTGAPTVRHRRSEEPGAKMIERASKTTFSVRVIIAQEERAHRAESIKRADQEYETQMRALPRPGRLKSVDAALAEIAKKLDQQKDVADRKDFKDRAVSNLLYMLGLARRRFVEPGKYSLDDDSICEFERIAEQLESVITGAEVHGVDILEIESPAESSPTVRLADCALQRFLRDVSCDMSLVENEKPEDV